MIAAISVSAPTVRTTRRRLAELSEYVVETANALVPVARARVSLRVAPGEDVRKARDLMIEHLRAAAPWGVQVTIEPGDLPPDLLGMGGPLPDTDDLRNALRHYERLHISRVLRQWPDKREAAKRLKLGLSSLYRKIEELNIEV